MAWNMVRLRTICWILSHSHWFYGIIPSKNGWQTMTMWSPQIILVLIYVNQVSSHYKSKSDCSHKLPILGPPHCASSHTHVCSGSIKYLLQMQVFMFDFFLAICSAWSCSNHFEPLSLGISHWWCTYPPEKWWSSSDWIIIPISQLLGKIKFMFQTTNQILLSG